MEFPPSTVMKKHLLWQSTFRLRIYDKVLQGLTHSTHPHSFFPTHPLILTNLIVAASPLRRAKPKSASEKREQSEIQSLIELLFTKSDVRSRDVTVDYQAKVSSGAFVDKSPAP